MAYQTPNSTFSSFKTPVASLRKWHAIRNQTEMAKQIEKDNLRIL
jgi:hypothetical protein